MSLRQATEHLQEAVDKVIEWGRKNLLLLRKKPQLSLEDAIAGRGECEVRLQGAIGVHSWIL